MYFKAQFLKLVYITLKWRLLFKIDFEFGRLLLKWLKYIALMKIEAKNGFLKMGQCC